MTPSALNTLFGVPANQTATAKPASNSTAFGDMLSREINGRQSAARPAPPSPRADNPPPAQRQQQPNAANVPKTAESQNVNRSQNQQAAAAHKEQQADAPDAGDAARSAAADAPPTGKNAATDGVDKTANGSKKDKSDKTDKADKADKVDESATAATAASDPAASSAASAELLALVASMMPKGAGAAVAPDPAVTQAAAAAVGVIDPNAAKAKGGTTALATGAVSVDASPEAADPAFDALLAQAATSTIARGHAKSETGVNNGANTINALPTARTDTDPAQARNNAGAAAMLSAKSEEIVLVTSVVQTAATKAEPTASSGVPGLGGAVPTGLTQATGGAATDTLTPRVGSPAWDHALGQKVVWMAAGAQQSASLTLNPPDLGPIQIVINVSNANADASFTAAQPEVRQALEAALPRLKEMLGEAGITLGQASVNAGNPGQSGAFEQQASTGPRRATGAVGREPLDNEPVGRTTTRIISGGSGLVDTFA